VLKTEASIEKAMDRICVRARPYLEDAADLEELEREARFGQRRSTQRKVPCGAPDEERLTEDIIELARTYGRYGYRLITGLLNNAGWQVTRGVLGERRYFAGGPRLRRDLPTLFKLANVPTFAAFLWFAWQRDVAVAVSTGLLVAVLKFWFLDRMVALYDASSAAQLSNQAG
jgi:hypothetical protein